MEREGGGGEDSEWRGVREGEGTSTSVGYPVVTYLWEDNQCLQHLL